MIPRVLTSSARTGEGSDEWGTPQDLFDDLNRRFGPFVLDASATRANTKCVRWIERNPAEPAASLKFDWATHAQVIARMLGIERPAIWLNPKYSPAEQPCKAGCKLKRCAKRGRHTLIYEPGLSEFVYKAAKTGEQVRVGCLLPNRSDQPWFQGLVVPIIERRAPGVVEFIKGRVAFEGANCKGGAPFPSIFVLFQPPNEVRPC